VIDTAVRELEPFMSMTVACQLVGKSRASLYRQRNPTPSPEAPATSARPAPPWALTDTERVQLLAVLNADRFADKAPAQVWAILLDEGAYLGSISTMYRLLRAEGQVRDRRAQATHPPRVRPELLADGPDQVWSWDITKLKGPWRDTYFDLYVMLDIFSRKAMRWEVHTTENAALAEAFIQNAIIDNGGVCPRAVHADRGTSMTSKPVAALLADLHVTQSHSRPHVSNDNPYSEAQFKTLKYCPAFPDRFGSLTDARTFCDAFFHYYNSEHRHSGIGLYTPVSVHDGTAVSIRAHRQKVLDKAYAANPDRFHGRQPQAPALPTRVWINQPRPKIESEVAA